MSKVPGRFLGYAFCVGDLLLELDLDFSVLNADGAVKQMLESSGGSGGNSNFLDLLTERGKGVIKASVKTLTGANRLGPFDISVGPKGAAKEPYVVFMAKLPHAPNRLYFVLSKPYRVGKDGANGAAASATAAQTEDKKQKFFDRLEGLFEGNADAEKNMEVTVVDAASDEGELGEQKQQEIEEYLKSFSVGGSLASSLGDEKFAFVHEKAAAGAKKIDYAREIEKATGVAIAAATIDAAEAKLSQEDSMKAMVFSLHQFANQSEGFDVADIEKNCSTLIGETTERVAAFRKVLEDGAFTLVYQPIVHLKKGTTHHFEALTRFDLPEMIKSQWEMIRFAEDVGLIPDFDRAVIARTITKLRELLRAGAAPAIAVNCSGRSLSDAEFILDLISTLKGNKDLKNYLSIEITESSQITDLDTLGDALKEIRKEGFRVYLDDFGAGAAGFQYLKKLTVDALKIDGDYVRNATISKEDRAYLRAMVTLCRDLGIVTVGEWVETKEHADLLTEMGVDYGQGYYFGKPSPGLKAAHITVEV
jgi:EAL domain-containing protein (putative c-di-GMP-specific phosphodiesterase class I)